MQGEGRGFDIDDDVDVDDDDDDDDDDDVTSTLRRVLFVRYTVQSSSLRQFPQSRWSPTVPRTHRLTDTPSK
jgi:hypothetical protein